MLGITLLIWGPAFPQALVSWHHPKVACCPCPRPEGGTQPLNRCLHHLVLEPECLGNISPLCAPSLYYCLSGSESLLSFFPHLCRSVSRFLLVLCLLISEALLSSSVSQCPYPGVSVPLLGISPHLEACSLEIATGPPPPADQTMGCR